ncbi:hypothetical protein VNO77_41352 [Canavalia gladiata]|uniref:Uncharacterized protein n=1 Tax=Canavalia gladiata TaxID=3824 RepID=A0AAN9PRK1_CANGL
MDTTVASSITILFLFFLFTFTSARVPFHIYIDHHSNPHSFSFSASQNNPANKPQPQPATIIPSEPHSVPSSEPKAKTVKSTEKPKQSSNPLPFTVFRLDPPIPRRPSRFSSRLGHRCHSWIPPQSRRQSHGVGDKNFETMTRGRVRHMARGWTRFGHVQPMLSRKRGMVAERSELLRRLYHRHHRDQEVKDSAGLIKRIRKFLNHF